MPEESTSPFSTIRQMAADIIRNSTDLLRINPSVVSGELKQNLEAFRTQNTKNLLSFTALSPESEMGLILFFSAVNFCYRDPTSSWDYIYSAQDGRLLRSTSAVITALMESGLDWNVLRQAASLDTLQWLHITQLNDHNVLYLGIERRERIVGLALYLEGLGFQTVLDFIKANDFSVLNLTSALVSSGFFQDEFLKRAQVALKRIDGIAVSRLGRGLTGIELLTCMADYSIPQLFYNLGAVELNPSLKKQLMDLTPLISGSREELSLRATSVVIGQQMAQSLSINEAEANTLLWDYSQQMVTAGQMKIPHMLVCTDKY